MKKTPKKLLIISPDAFFLYWPGWLNGPKTEIPYHQKSANAGLGIQTGIKTFFFDKFLHRKQFFEKNSNGQGQQLIVLNPFRIPYAIFFNLFKIKIQLSMISRPSDSRETIHNPKLWAYEAAQLMRSLKRSSQQKEFRRSFSIAISIGKILHFCKSNSWANLIKKP